MPGVAALKRVNGAIQTATEWIGRSVAWLTLGMMAMITASVVLRYGLDLGSRALQESILYLHAGVFMLGAGYTLKHNGHVRVDVFYRGFRAETRALIDLLGTLFLMIPVCVFIGVVSWDFVVNAWRHWEVSQDAGIPIYLLRSFIWLFVATLVLQAVGELLRNLLFLLGEGPDPKADDAEERG